MNQSSSVSSQYTRANGGIFMQSFCSFITPRIGRAADATVCYRCFCHSKVARNSLVRWPNRWSTDTLWNFSLFKPLKITPSAISNLRSPGTTRKYRPFAPRRSTNKEVLLMNSHRAQICWFSFGFCASAACAILSISRILVNRVSRRSRVLMLPYVVSAFLLLLFSYSLQLSLSCAGRHW